VSTRCCAFHQKPGEIDDFLNAFNEMSFADSIFTGDRFIKPDGSHTPEQVLLRMAQARHEQINERFKEFGILTQRFRNDRAWHPTVVNAIANVVQLQLWFECFLTSYKPSFSILDVKNYHFWHPFFAILR